MVLTEEYIHKIIIDEINQNVSFYPDQYHLIDSFERLNKQFFGNKLRLCAFRTDLQQNYVGFFKYDGITQYGMVNPTIWINGNYQFTSNQLDSVVAHEMIHYYLAAIGSDLKCGHGPEFQSMANRINAQGGLNIDETVDTSNMTYGQNNATINQNVIAQLGNYERAFQSLNSQLQQQMSNKGGQILSFMQTLFTFDTALINALQRCVSKQSLNEGGEFSKAIGDFRNGFNKWYDWMDDALTPPKNSGKGNGSGDTAYGYSTANGYQNATLTQLLFSIFKGQIMNEHDKVDNATNNALSQINIVEVTMDKIMELSDFVESQYQTQGQNP